MCLSINIVNICMFVHPSLTRQWTMEDEEEVEREKRRRVRSSTSTADPDELSPGHSPKGSLTNEGTPEQISSNDSAAARSRSEEKLFCVKNQTSISV